MEIIRDQDGFDDTVGNILVSLEKVKPVQANGLIGISKSKEAAGSKNIIVCIQKLCVHTH
jgi:hypothetical protein